MKISELQAQQNATLENVEVVSKEEPRSFEKFGKQIRVCNATIKDDSGEVQLTLWNDEIEQVQAGDKISIIDGWVKEWQDKLQISAGRSGKLVKAGEAEAAPAEAAPEAEATEEVVEEAPAAEEAPEAEVAEETTEEVVEEAPAAEEEVPAEESTEEAE